MTTASPSAPMTWPWRDSPAVRFLGAVLSWFLFAFCFTTLYLTAFTVMALGGYCASGGPYQIEVECPANVLAFTPWNIFGGLLAVAIGALFGQGFGTPLIVWAWPILFVGLSVPFFVSAYFGGWFNGVIGVMFVVMGLVPVWLFIKGGELAISLRGTRNIHGRNFRNDRNTPGSVLVGRRPDPGPGAVAANAGDWALALGITIVAGGAGIWIAQLAWDAASA